MTRRVALVPGVLALLPEYASLHDPVADLRAACLTAVSWLGKGGVAVRVVADPQGARVARSLLAAAGLAEDGGADVGGAQAVLVVANGSARRTEKAPGHLDERAAGFDAALGAALGTTGGRPDPAALTGLDAGLGAELLAGGLDALHELGGLLGDSAETVAVDYDDDPYGVQYWVTRWTCDS